ncbi:AAA family ATPase [Vibrio gigantis]|uniref:ATP-dependent nuclease n=1 Tax=Vibrio gigantis TaxID=296199 RepID=UPI002FC61093
MINPRLRKLTIRNFRSIGSQDVDIELDDIVVLVGPNNAGKSSILRAYEVVMSEGSAQGKLTLQDFPNEVIDNENKPTIIVESVVYEEHEPGPEWILTDDSSKETYIKEKWEWEQEGAPKRVGWSNKLNDWHQTKKPWGAPNVAQAYRPEPHRVDAFADPEKQSSEIVKLLHKALTDRVKDLSAQKNDEPSPYEQLLANVAELQKMVLGDVSEQIAEVEKDVEGLVRKVFPNYKIVFDAKPEDDLDKCINLFKNQPDLRLGPTDGYLTEISKQGSGARRTLLWAALRILSEHNRIISKKSVERPHVLLLDEPELCLHPNAVRDACKVLYDLPVDTNWQVMVTTHSPAFIDLSRDNTSIIRVERSDTGIIKGTTIYRPQRAKLEEDDKVNLKLLNIFDPNVAEFFFGGKNVLVEGDTEYTAFKHVIAKHPAEFSDVNIIRARGKATLVSLAKILNQFGSPYALLHDSDRPYCKQKDLTKKPRKNSAWATNENIQKVVEVPKEKGLVRLVASVPNLEEAFFGEEAANEKPYSALITISKNENKEFDTLKDLLVALTDFTKPLPENALEWEVLGDLEEGLKD